MIEFFGEISEATQRRSERLRRRYFARWVAALAVVALVVAVASAFGGGWAWVAPSVCFVLLAAVAAWLAVREPRIRAPWLVRIVLEGDTLTFTQYAGEKTIVKKRRIDCAKRVLKGEYAYWIVFNDVSNAVVCERRLLKRGTFSQLEALFAGKIRPF